MASRWILQTLDDEGHPLTGYPLSGSSCSVGSAEGNSVILDHASVSSNHAKLLWDEEEQGWFVQDLGSTNGTWYRNEELKGIQALQENDLIEFGLLKCKLLREEVEEPAAEEPPPVLPEPEVEAQAETAAQPEAAPEPVPEPEQEAAAEPAALSEMQSEPKTQSEPESGSEAGSEQATDSEPPATESKPSKSKKAKKPKKEKKPKAPKAPKQAKAPKAEKAARSPARPLSMKEPVQLFYALCSILHDFLAKWLPILIGGSVRIFSAMPLPLRFMLGFIILAGITSFNGWYSLPRYTERFEFDDNTLAFLTEAGALGRIQRLMWMGRISGGLLLIIAVLAWLKKKISLWLMKAGVALFLLYWFYIFNLYTQIPELLNDWDYKAFANNIRNEFWMRSWLPWFPALFPASLCALGLSLRSIHNVYKKEEKEAPLQGDMLSENLATGGRDPRMRSSSYWALFLFVFSIAGPFLMRGCGFEKPYGLVKGSGDPVVEMVKVKKKKKKPKKKMIVNNWSPYIFERMKIDDIKVLEDIEENTLDTYEVQQTKSGKLGVGGGDKGGWPEGMEGAVVRFIRIKYSGGDWDQDMGKGSDYNLLIRFNEITGFPIAKETEAKTPSRLRMFPKGKKPPFVYLTGKGGMRFSSNDIKTLRWYTIEEGGMLFIDNGGGRFHSSVQSTLAQIFPGQRLVDIPNDDPIYQAPFLFPGGAPPLWQHAGKRALGIRHDGRWVVFYHPGDMGDAWKDGHSGASGAVAEQAYRLGINVMYYAFNMYYARHYE